jgi:hypothetical protein
MSALHDATLCSWACRRDATIRVIHRGTMLDAVDLLLVSAVASPPATCFSRGLDALRVELDGGTGLEGELSYRAPNQRRRVHAIRRVLLACGVHADAATLASAEQEALSIAGTPPPVGDGLATQALLSAVPLLEAARGETWYRVSWVNRGAFLDAAEDLSRRIPQLRDYRDDELPGLFDRFSREVPPKRTVFFGDRDKGGFTLNGLLDVGDQLVEVLKWHAHLDRELRLIVVALAAMRERVAAGAYPDAGPAELTAPPLRDPLTGEPFAWSIASAEGRATIVAHAARGEDAEAVALP